MGPGTTSSDNQNWLVVRLATVQVPPLRHLPLEMVTDRPRVVAIGIGGAETSHELLPLPMPAEACCLNDNRDFVKAGGDKLALPNGVSEAEQLGCVGAADDLGMLLGVPIQHVAPDTLAWDDGGRWPPRVTRTILHQEKDAPSYDRHLATTHREGGITMGAQPPRPAPSAKPNSERALAPLDPP